jgi:4-hydroxy-2-oxoheptanedioate aldolase
MQTMRRNKLRQILKDGKPSFSTHIHSTWPSLIEAIGHTGLYDYVEFVAEYGPYDIYDFDNMARAAELFDMDLMIKVDFANQRYVSQRAIGSGFGSVLYADCHTVEDAQECVKSARPDTIADGGTYGVATRRFTYMGYGGTQDYVTALQDVVVMLMIEKKDAVDNLEEMLSIPGVDMIQWGGADYSMNIGKPGRRNDPEIKAVEKYVFETALKMGVQPRVEINSPDQARAYLDWGVQHFSIGTDIHILHDWWKKNGEELHKVVEGA